MQFRHARFIVRPPDIQLFIVTVIHTRRLFSHGVRENIVYRFNNGGSAAEVHGQIDAPIDCFGTTFEGHIFFQKQGGVRQTEAIDTLLNIPDHKAICAVGYQGSYQFLHTVRILILVNKNFLKGTSHFLSSGRRKNLARLLITNSQNLQTIMFQISEIKPIFFTFRLVIRLIKIAN